MTRRPPDAADPLLGIVGEPVWTGGTRAVRCARAGRLSGVRLRLVDVSGGVGAHQAGWPPAVGDRLAGAGRLAAAGEPVLAGGPGQPPIIARRAWARGDGHPRVAPAYGAVRDGVRASHREPQRLPAGRGAGDAAGDLRLPPRRPRLERHRLQLRDRRLRADLRGARGRHRRAGRGRAGRRLQPRLDRRGGARLVHERADLAGRQARPAQPAGVEAVAARVPAAGRVTVRVNPAGPSTAASRPTPASRCRASPAIATATRPTAPAMRSTASCRHPGRASCRLAPRPVRATIARQRPPAPAQTPAPAAPGAAAAVQPRRAAKGSEGALAFLDGTPIAGAAILIQQISVARRGRRSERADARAARDRRPGTLALGARRRRACRRSRPGSMLRALYARRAGGAAPGRRSPIRCALGGRLQPARSAAPTQPAAAPPAS